MASVESVLGIIGVGFLLLAIPSIADQGVTGFGLSGITGETVTASFPAWENQSSVFDRVNETADGELTLETDADNGVFESVEQSNNPDEFQLIKVNYTTLQPVTDNEINLTIKAYDSQSMSDAATQSVILEDGENTFVFDERIKGSFLKVQAELSKAAASDPAPVLNSTSVKVETIDASEQARVYQDIIMLAVIGFTVILGVLILGD